MPMPSVSPLDVSDVVADPTLDRRRRRSFTAEFKRRMLAQAEALRAEGASVMYLAIDGQPVGLPAVSDPVKASTAEALATRLLA